jgi:hypothetical protein
MPVPPRPVHLVPRTAVRRLSFPVRLTLLAVGGAVAAAVACRPAHGQVDARPDQGCAGEVSRIEAPRTFLGYLCRDADCGAHKAGFAWADRNGVTDPVDCAGASEPAFAEGCRAFVEDAVTAESSGFQWARENGIGDRCRCDGAGPRFEAGCEAWVMIAR